ncbi:MAG: hypothetical protein AB1846_05695 [Chloroflexota bacterium]
MPEKKSRRDEFKERIPKDVREHVKAAREEMRQSFEALMPPGYREHRRAARREMLLAWRSMIDHVIERMDERSPKAD